MPLRAVVLSVTREEPAVRLIEMNRRVLVQGHSEDHRFQTIELVRSDRIVNYEADLGMASKFTGEPFVIVSADVNHPVKVLRDLDTVGAMMDMAEARRNAKPFNVEYGVPTPDLVGSYIQAIEEAFKQQEHISTFGSHFTKQRTR